MIFTDRIDGGRRLAERIVHLRNRDVVVVGLPRGGVPVAAEVAKALNAPLDVILVRKLGVPSQPELAMGAIGENGVRVLNAEVVQMVGVTSAEIVRVEARERDELERRVERFRSGREHVSLKGRVVIIVDDGIATGSTARAACQVARAHGASHIVLAVPVAPRGWEQDLAGVADEYVCVAAVNRHLSVGQFCSILRRSPMTMSLTISTTRSRTWHMCGMERSPLTSDPTWWSVATSRFLIEHEVWWCLSMAVAVVDTVRAINRLLRYLTRLELRPCCSTY